MAHTYEHWKQDLDTLGVIINKLIGDSGIKGLGITYQVIENFDNWPNMENTVGLYVHNHNNSGSWVFIRADQFDESIWSRSDLLNTIYHEMAHAITANIYNVGGHGKNFHDTLENLVEDGFAARTLTQADLDVFEYWESGYNPDGIDRSDYILNDESDAVKLANFEIWLAESNPHEVNTPIAERWEAIQRGGDVSTIEEEVIGDWWLRHYFDGISEGGDGFNIDQYISWKPDSIDPDVLKDLFKRTDDNEDGIVDWDEYDDTFYVPISHENDILPYMLDLNMDGDVDISDAIDILRDIVGLEELTDAEFILADANRDGVVNISDAITTLRVIVGLTTVEDLADDFFVPALDLT